MANLDEKTSPALTLDRLMDYGHPLEEASLDSSALMEQERFTSKVRSAFEALIPDYEGKDLEVFAKHYAAFRPMVSSFLSEDQTIALLAYRAVGAMNPPPSLTPEQDAEAGHLDRLLTYRGDERGVELSYTLEKRTLTSEEWKEYQTIEEAVWKKVKIERGETDTTPHFKTAPMDEPPSPERFMEVLFGTNWRDRVRDLDR